MSNQIACFLIFVKLNVCCRVFLFFFFYCILRQLVIYVFYWNIVMLQPVVLKVQHCYIVALLTLFLHCKSKLRMQKCLLCKFTQTNSTFHKLDILCWLVACYIDLNISLQFCLNIVINVWSTFISIFILLHIYRKHFVSK